MHVDEPPWLASRIVAHTRKCTVVLFRKLFEQGHRKVYASRTMTRRALIRNGTRECRPRFFVGDDDGLTAMATFLEHARICQAYVTICARDASKGFYEVQRHDPDQYELCHTRLQRRLGRKMWHFEREIERRDAAARG